MAKSKKTQLIETILEKFPHNTFRFSDIQKAWWFLTYGLPYEKWNSKDHRGGCINKNLGEEGYLRYPGIEKRYFEKSSNGSWYIANI